MSSRRQPEEPAGSRRGQARHKAAELRAAELARERRRRTATVTGAVLAVLALVVALGVYYQSQRSSPTGPVAAPAGVTDGGVVTGSAAAPVTLTVYEDFQCPSCKAFEAQSGATVDALRDAGTVRVVYKPIAFLDRASTTRYSSRALNAAACLLQEAPQGFAGLHDALFARQPAEGSAGLSNAALLELVSAAGAPNAKSCIDNLTYGDWVEQVTDRSSRDGVRQTPTVRLNGKDPARSTDLTDLTPAGLTAAVDRARG